MINYSLYIKNPGGLENPGLFFICINYSQNCDLRNSFISFSDFPFSYPIRNFPQPESTDQTFQNILKLIFRLPNLPEHLTDT